MVVNLKVKSLEKVKDELKWKSNKKYSYSFIPSLEKDIFNDFLTEEENIKFDSTYTIDPQTLIKHTDAPIIIGGDSQNVVPEVEQMVQHLFKDEKKKVFMTLDNIPKEDKPK
mmetsp:Transcript_23789/g.21136  ORF Transcript_23789/g.21136 Transcript_23789/m.21136 type:complete len:112 (-) Transcript_23789:478-813(-)